MTDNAKKYNLQKRILTVTNFSLEVILLIVLLFSNLSSELRDICLQITSSQWIIVFLYLVITGIFFEILSLPLSFYSGYVLEHKFNLSNQTLGDWILDEIKGIGIGALLGIFLGEILYFLLREYSAYWWVIGGTVFTILAIILANLAPVLIMPIFFKFKPLNNEELKDRLIALASKAMTKIKGVYEMDLSRKSKTANAVLAGLGNTRRIIVSDTMLENYSKEEIEVVFAHELGHHVGKHLFKGIVFQTVIIFLSFYSVNLVLNRCVNYFGFYGISDIASFPLFALVIMSISLIALPLANGFSRRLERFADRKALELTRNSESFITAMEKLARQNLADRNPNALIEFIFYSHPSVGKRIEFAKNFVSEKAT